MRAIVAIRSLEDNSYFAEKSKRIFGDVTYLPKRPKEEELEFLLSEYEVIIIGAREKISREMLEGRTIKTCIIGTLSVGTDHLDMDALAEHNIHVERCPTANVRSVAEHALALILALAKCLKWGDILVANRNPRSDLPSLPTEVQGKTLGLIGYGNIGGTLGSLASLLGMTVIATSRSRQSGSSGAVEFGTLETILAKSHFVSISVPLTPETRDLLNFRSFDSMRKGAILVNTSRVEVVVENDLSAALDSGRLGGYGGDYDGGNHELAKRPNVILTPHMAGLTVESNDRLDNELIDRLSEYLAK